MLKYNQSHSHKRGCPCTRTTVAPLNANPNQRIQFPWSFCQCLKPYSYRLHTTAAVKSTTSIDKSVKLGRRDNLQTLRGSYRYAAFLSLQRESLKTMMK